jgi:two-component system response regulator PilR (NtrC family)
MQSQFFEVSSRSRWLANQAASSASMIEKMVREELRRGDFSKMHERVTRIEELVNEHVLETARERELLLLAAVLLEGGGETRAAYRLSGKLLADKERLDHSFLSSLRRFRVRLALNRGDIKEARGEIALTERVVMETLRGLGEITETIDHDDLSHVTAATWLVSAEVSLAEGQLDQALQDLANARSCMSVSGCRIPDENVLFELLSALACVSLNDVGGAAALAHLYNSHVILRSESSVEALTSARIAATVGDMAHTIGISEAEARRWRGYGPEPDIVQHYLREGSSVPATAIVEHKLPSPNELIAALDESLIDVNTKAAVVQHSTKVSNLDLLPMAFLFEYFRLEEVTGMFDYNRKTGHLTVDWSRCDPVLLSEAADVGAISEFVLRCKSGTIYLNHGSYVDAVLESNEEQLRNMAATDVIFELFRISTAGLPGSGALQFQGGSEAVRIPEVINLRPNKLNLELTKRLDHMRWGKSDVEVDADDMDLDAAFANWESSAPSAMKVGAQREDQAKQLVNVSVGGLATLLPLLQCEDVVSLELSVVECLGSIGISQSRVEIVSSESGEKLRECGLSAEFCDTWGTCSVGPLSLVLGLGKNIRVDSAETVDVILKVAGQRLRTLPGSKVVRKFNVSGFIAEDPAMQSVLSQLREIAPLDGYESPQKMVHVLLLGQRGTGKELLARLIHEWSRRSGETFQVANLGAIAHQLAPAEIFGSKKGSFTGSIADRIGYIQKAEGGTLFLDEVDEANETTQALLKRVVQFGTYNIVGSPDESSCNVRFVGATNRGLDEDGCIKPDLKDRFWIVRIPPLRERRSDIPALAQYFAGQHNYSLPEPVLAYLADLQWPGNVRQLETVVERVCAVVKSAEEVNLAAFECAVRESGTNPVVSDCGNEFSPLAVGETLKDRQDAQDRWHINYALRLTNWHKTAAAQLLGMKRQTMQFRMKSLGMPLDKPQR